MASAREVAAGRRFSVRGLLVAVPTALTASLIAVLVIRYLAVSGTTSTAKFPPLAVTSDTSLTVIGVLLAGATCQVLNRLSPHPIESFRRVAPVALLLSFIPDLVIWTAHVYPQTRASTILPLMAMHLAVATICITTLPSLGWDRASNGNRRHARH